MGNLSLALLGPPEVRHADQLLLFSTRKEQALLLYLAVEGRIHSRKSLSEQFWPEGDASHGRAALRITLLHLRHLLGEDTDASPLPHLLVTRDTLGLDVPCVVRRRWCCWKGSSALARHGWRPSFLPGRRWKEQTCSRDRPLKAVVSCPIGP